MRHPDEILAMSKYARKRRRLKQKRKKYSKEVRGPFDRQMLLEHLRESGIRSWRKYKAARKSGDPTVYDYRKEFGSWEVACHVAFGKDPIEVKKLDHNYIYLTIIQFNLWTLRAYLEARKVRPDVLPSRARLREEWGRWSNVKDCAQRASTARTVDEYIKLWRRLGRKPKKQDCKDVGLVIDEAIAYYGSKKEMDIAVAEMRRYE
jgi:hypothetical protein